MDATLQATPSQIGDMLLQGINDITSNHGPGNNTDHDTSKPDTTGANQTDNGKPAKTPLSKEELEKENAILRQQIEFLKRQNNTTRYHGFTKSSITWKEICNCVKHEMSSNLALSIKKIIEMESNALTMNDTQITQQSINILIAKLISNRKYHFEEPQKKYLESLIQRAKQFDPNQRTFFKLFLSFSLKF